MSTVLLLPVHQRCFPLRGRRETEEKEGVERREWGSLSLCGRGGARDDWRRRTQNSQFSPNGCSVVWKKKNGKKNWSSFYYALLLLLGALCSLDCPSSLSIFGPLNFFQPSLKRSRQPRNSFVSLLLHEEEESSEGSADIFSFMSQLQQEPFAHRKKKIVQTRSQKKALTRIVKHHVHDKQFPQSQRS